MSQRKTLGHPFALERFEVVQTGAYQRACEELRAGRKRSHWIWYIFPQMKGLGSSEMARIYGISSLDEARAYLAHPVLGPRLIEVTGLMLALHGRALGDILGSPDDMKFRSSMTLFSTAADIPDNIFAKALETFCAGEPDIRTLALLNGG